MPEEEKIWSCSIRFSFTYYPEADPVTAVFLDSDGKAKSDILKALPYRAARAPGGGDEGGQPDERRYRDPRMVFEQIGLLQRTDDDVVALSRLGRALSSWRSCLNEGNLEVVGAHVAGSLAACQLRNPTRLGSKYDPGLNVFPMAFIWRAMLALDNRIYSDELNREVFRLTNAEELPEMIGRIRANRQNPAVPLQPETLTDAKKNDRIISWMAMASCGWLLVKNKRETQEDYYEIRPSCVDVLQRAVLSQGLHTEFPDIPSYLDRLHMAAMLPYR
jgi:hypothetical protein